MELIATFGTRFNRLLDKAGYPKAVNARRDEVAKNFDVSPPTARKWIKGIALPNPLVVIEIAKRFSVSLDWLLGGKEDAQTNALVIPVYRMEGGTSLQLVQVGSAAYDMPASCDTDRISRAWVRNWVEMKDPAFKLDDAILVDLNDVRLSEDGIFLVRTGSMFMWRRIAVPLDGNLILTSVAGSGREERTVLKTAQIDLNESGTIAPKARSKPIVVGRVIARREQLGFHTCPVY